MDFFTEVLSTLLAGLSAILTAIAAAAASRHRDGRLAGVAAALGLLSLVGFLSLLHQLSPLYGGGFEVDPIPLAVIVVAVGLLYVAFTQSRAPPPSAKHA